MFGHQKQQSPPLGSNLPWMLKCLIKVCKCHLVIILFLQVPCLNFNHVIIMKDFHNVLIFWGFFLVFCKKSNAKILFYFNFIWCDLRIHVATLLWPSVGVKPNIWKKWGFGILRDSRMFRARQQGPKHLALRCSWCHWKGLEA